MVCAGIHATINHGHSGCRCLGEPLLPAAARQVYLASGPVRGASSIRAEPSFAPTLTGRGGEQEEHKYLYWNFYEGGSAQAVRTRQWKGVRKPMLAGRIELYDVTRDEAEKYDIALNHLEVVKEVEGMMAEAHVAHPNWKPPAQ